MPTNSTSINFWTIGHSNHSIEVFIELLTQHRIELLVDVRRFPGSRKFPHLKQENLKRSVEEYGIDYHRLEGLGGRRNTAPAKTPSLNDGLRNQSFRNYADHMLTEAFEMSFAELIELSVTKRAAIMCGESVFWRCHRRLISDYAVASGGTVIHIFPDGRTQQHQLTKEAVIPEPGDARILYPGQPTLF